MHRTNWQPAQGGLHASYQSVLSTSPAPWIHIDRPDDSAADPTADPSAVGGRGAIWSENLSTQPWLVNLTLGRGRSRPTLFEAESGTVAPRRDARAHPDRWFPALSRNVAVSRSPRRRRAGDTNSGRRRLPHRGRRSPASECLF